MPRPAEPPSPRRSGALALALALGAGCSQSGLVGRTGAATGDAAPPTYDAAPFDGPGFVDGHVHSHAVFDTIGSVLWFGGSGDSSKIEVYIFESTPSCDDVSIHGWLPSSKVRPADVMGFTIAGNKPGVYPVVPEDPPRRGNAYVLHVIDQTDPVIQSEGISGSVTITSVKPGEVVSGAFQATFTTGTLEGAFNAVWCPTGDGL